MSQPATHETDVLVVGSGNGALTATLCARELGVRDVLLIEKSPPRSGGLAVHVAKGQIGRSVRFTASHHRCAHGAQVTDIRCSCDAPIQMRH